MRNIGLAVALSGVILLVVLRVGTGFVTSSAETDRSREVSGAVLAIGTALLQRSAWAGIFLGVLIALFATLVGSSKLAGHAQRLTAAGFRRQAVAMWIGFAVLILVLLAWSPISTPDNWLSLLIIVALVVVGIEALRRTSLAEEATEEEEEREEELGEAVLAAAERTDD